MPWATPMRGLICGGSDGRGSKPNTAQIGSQERVNSRALHAHRVGDPEHWEGSPRFTRSPHIIAGQHGRC